MLLRSGRCRSSRRSPRSSCCNKGAATWQGRERNGKGRRGSEGGEGKVEGRREGEGREGQKGDEKERERLV